MPPRKKKVVKRKPAQKQKQKQKQSVVVNINQQRKTVARQPSQPRPVQPPPSVNPVFNFSTPDNTSSIISAIQGLNRQQGDVIRDVVKVNVAEERATPEQVRQQRLRVLDNIPQHAGLSSEEFDSSLGYETLPEELPVARKKRTKRVKLNIVRAPVESLNVLQPIQEAVREELVKPPPLKKPLPPIPLRSRSESQFDRLLRRAEEEEAPIRTPQAEVREIGSDEAFRARLKEHNKGLRRDDPNFIRLHEKTNTNTGSSRKKSIQELQQEARDKGLNFLFTQAEVEPVEPEEPVGFSFPYPSQSSITPSSLQENLSLVGGGGARGSIYAPFEPQKLPFEPEKVVENRPPARTFTTQLSFETGTPITREEIPVGRLPRTETEVITLPSGEPKLVRRLKAKEPESLFNREQSLLKQKIREQQEGKDTSDIEAELLKISNARLQQPIQFIGGGAEEI